MRTVILLITLAAGTLCAAMAAAEESSTCTYQTYNWNVKLNRVADLQTVRHSRTELTPDELDSATGCTVCSEDQEFISLPGILPFRICKKLAPSLRGVLATLISQGEPIHAITGYRVGKTRGGIDAKGNRTLFSNHSFGIALDINEDLNGLYDNCQNFGPGCRLVRGGTWRPGRKGVLTADSPIVRELKATGFRWGGEIEGNLKDFMHFSPTGY